jgi:crotonobetaine/carnitine-CoA ligase
MPSAKPSTKQETQLSEQQQRHAAFHYAGRDIGWLLAQRAALRGSHPFLLWEPRSGHERRWTYAEFLDTVQRVGAGLHARGIGKGDRVLIHSENCPEMVFAWYACALVGAISVNTNAVSVASELAYFASHAKVRAAITQPKFARLVAENAGKIDWLAVTPDNSGDEASESESDHPGEPFAKLVGDSAQCPKRPPEPFLPYGIVYTSGTTSLPKAVVHTHANYLWAARTAATILEMGPEDVNLAMMPFFHVNAQLWSTAPALWAGGSVLLLPRVSVSAFWPAAVKHGVTHMSVMPLIERGVADDPVPPGQKFKILQGGIAPRAFAARLGAKAIAAYGMSETVCQTIHTDTKSEWPARAIGRPFPGYEVRIVDPETGRDCEPGVPGECLVRGVRGVQLFLEYYENAEANAKAFTDDGWFRTGDIMSVDESGSLIYMDRDKDRLKVGGENVSASEVERVILQIAGVSEAAVIGKPDPMLGAVPVAFVVRTPGAPDEAEIRAAILALCESTLSKFKRPREVLFVDEFPRATLNKIAKAKLRELLPKA